MTLAAPCTASVPLRHIANTTPSLIMMGSSPQRSFENLPDSSQKYVTFQNTTWSRTHGLIRSLPTPEQIRARFQEPIFPYSQLIAKFEELDLIVKFGEHVTISEIVCLRIVKELSSNRVPVPEVYGWAVDDHHVFLYMQLIRGPSLLERWPTMNQGDRASVCNHLRVILKSLRLIKQDPSMKFIGNSICWKFYCFHTTYICQVRSWAVHQKIEY